MLLARVAAELRTNRGLSSHLLPIRFMEESHEIFSAADFWLDVLFYLSLETRTQDAELARNLRDTHADLTTRWRERELDERARAAVLDVADRLGKRLVIMVENLQGLCANVDEHFGWHLRKTLQSEPQIILLASATSRFEGLDDAQDPFFELFRIISLQPLNTVECRGLWHAVTGDTASSRQIRPLEVLTGGSPRLLIVIAGFARHRSMRRLMEELVELIDDHTEYFRGHLEAIGKTERRVYLAVVDLWTPSSTGEIAARARMDVRTVSTMLGRLVERGALIADGTRKKRLYAASERIYSIYYKLRRERDEAAIVQNLVRFMAAFYSDSETAELFATLKLDAWQSFIILEGIDRVRPEIPKVPEMISDLAHDATTLNDAGVEGIQRGEFSAAIAACDDLIARFGASDATELQVQVIRALINKGHLHGRLGHHALEIEAYRTVVERYGPSDAPELQVEVAGAQYNRGVALARSGHHRAAIAACDEVIDRYAASDAPELERRVARALLNKGGEQAELGEHSAAIATLQTVADRYARRSEAELRDRVVGSLVAKAVTQDRLGDTESAIETLNEVEACYGASDEPGLNVLVACALVRKGAVLGRLGRYAEAIEINDQVVQRYLQSESPDLQQQVTEAIRNSAAALELTGNFDAAIAIRDEIVHRFGTSDAPELQARVVEALFHNGMMQIRLGFAEAALRTSDELERRIAGAADNTQAGFAWMGPYVRMTALCARERGTAAADAFCSVYAALGPNPETLITPIIEGVSSLLAAGVRESEIIAILSSEPHKASILSPLIIALRQRAGETIRAPAEILEVAADVHTRIGKSLIPAAGRLAGTP